MTMKARRLERITCVDISAQQSTGSGSHKKDNVQSLIGALKSFNIDRARNIAHKFNLDLKYYVRQIAQEYIECNHNNVAHKLLDKCNMQGELSDIVKSVIESDVMGCCFNTVKHRQEYYGLTDVELKDVALGALVELMDFYVYSLVSGVDRDFYAKTLCSIYKEYDLNDEMLYLIDSLECNDGIKRQIIKELNFDMRGLEIHEFFNPDNLFPLIGPRPVIEDEENPGFFF